METLDRVMGTCWAVLITLLLSLSLLMQWRADRRGNTYISLMTETSVGSGRIVARLERIEIKLGMLEEVMRKEIRDGRRG